MRGLLVVLLAALLMLPAVAAGATEDDALGGEDLLDEANQLEEEGEPTLDEVTQDNEIVQEFVPDEYEQPTVFAPIIWTLLGAGLLITLVLFLLYLVWQPNFGRERERARSRR